MESMFAKYSKTTKRGSEHIHVSEYSGKLFANLVKMYLKFKKKAK